MPLEIDVIVVSKNRPELLQTCLESLKNAIQATDDVYINIHLGEKNSDNRFSDELSAPDKRNILIRESTAEWLFFLDDDAYVPPEIFKNFRNLVGVHKDITVAGGPNLAPPGSSFEQLSQEKVLASKFWNPFFYKRYSLAKKKLTFSDRYFCLSNLFVRRSQHSIFRHSEFCGEELQLLLDLRIQGQPYLYDPTLFVFHNRRKTHEQFIQQIQAYGEGRGLFVLRNFPNPVVTVFRFFLIIFTKFGSGSPRILILKLMAAYFRGIEKGLGNGRLFVNKSQLGEEILGG